MDFEKIMAWFEAWVLELVKLIQSMGEWKNHFFPEDTVG